jgi:hypothetical protein
MIQVLMCKNCGRFYREEINYVAFSVIELIDQLSTQSMLGSAVNSVLF